MGIKERERRVEVFFYGLFMDEELLQKSRPTVRLGPKSMSQRRAVMLAQQYLARVNPPVETSTSHPKSGKKLRDLIHEWREQKAVPTNRLKESY
jgi:hypothetical protein